MLLRPSHTRSGACVTAVRRYLDGCTERHCLREWIAFKARPRFAIEDGEVDKMFVKTAAEEPVEGTVRAAAQREIHNTFKLAALKVFEQQVAATVAQHADVAAMAQPHGAQRRSGC